MEDVSYEGGLKRKAWLIVLFLLVICGLYQKKA